MMHLSLGRRFFGTAIGLSALALLASAAPVPATVAGDDDAAHVTRLADEYVREYIARNPEAATFEGLPDAPDDKLSDNSLEALAAWQAKEDGWLSRLAAIDGAALWGRPEWLTYGFLREALEGSKGLRIARPELWPVNQMSGWQAGLAQLASIQPVGTPAARQKALARFGRVPRYLDTEIVNLKEGLRLGYSTPKPNVELTLVQLDALLETPVGDSPFFLPAKRDGDAEFRAEWERLLKEEITPAVRRYRDFLRNEYLPKARTSVAISALPNGAEAYRALFRSMASLDRPAEETYRLGEKAVARIRSGGRGDRAKALQGPGPRGRQEEDGEGSGEPFPDPRRAPELHQGGRRPGPQGHAGLGGVHAQGRCRGRAHPRLSREDRVERLPVGSPRREPSRRLHDQPL